MVIEFFKIVLKLSISTGLRQALLPLPCRSCDWLESLKPSYTTDTLSFTQCDVFSTVHHSLLSTGVLCSRLQRATISDAVWIQFFLLKWAC